MPVRNRGAYIALGVSALLILGLAFWYALPGPEPISGHEDWKGYAYQYHAAEAGCEPRQLATLPPPKRADEERRCAADRQQHDFSQAYLAEYARAADAAEGQAHIAYRQARSGFVQTVATVSALIAAIAAAIAAGFAAHYARDAARHTKRSADAAEDGRHSARAWILYEGFTANPQTGAKYTDGEFLGDGLTVAINWRNCGSTPAINVTPYVEVRVIPLRPGENYETIEIPHFDKVILPTGNAVVAQGKPLHTSERFVRKSDVDNVRSGECVIAIYACVEYRTIFDGEQRRESEVCGIIVAGGNAQNPDGSAVQRWRFSACGPRNGCT